MALSKIVHVWWCSTPLVFVQTSEFSFSLEVREGVMAERVFVGVGNGSADAPAPAFDAARQGFAARVVEFLCALPLAKRTWLCAGAIIIRDCRRAMQATAWVDEEAGAVVVFMDEVHRALPGLPGLKLAGSAGSACTRRPSEVRVVLWTRTEDAD